MNYIDVMLKTINSGVNEIGKEYSKKVSVALIFNQNKILAVSRKNDPNDFGLPGGKVDEGESFEECAIREIEEETGLSVFGLVPIYYRMDGEFFAVCYLAQWQGEIKTSETGRVEWVDFDVITKGSFGSYNAELKKVLEKRGFFNNK